jgi:hypothetical protein
MPKIAIRTAPPAMRRVPRIIQTENTSPRMKHAKNAFHRRETAPNGARITTGREAIWNSEPRILEVMNMTEETRSDNSIGVGVETHGIQATITYVGWSEISADP